MQSYKEHNIQELPMSSPFFRRRVEHFLGENGLRMEDMDVYCTIENESGEMLAGAGIRKDIIKCIAVAQNARSEGLVIPLVSHLISLAASRGISDLKLFTKPENQAIFESLGFHVIARAPLAILMEKGRGLERYCEYLRTMQKPGRCGVVVMNANPFTVGHQYLLQKAAAKVDTLYVIPVREEGQRFPYAERVQMIKMAEDNFFSSAGSIIVLEGSAYQISAATFPTYFLKDLSEAAETHIRLDLDLFQHHIAPALNAEVRFVGTEPTDALTNHYNTIMKECLPQVVEIPRMKTSECAGLVESEEKWFFGLPRKKYFSSDGEGVISASAVRAALDRGCFREASALCPESTWPYLLADLAGRALQLELDTPGKPGLVGPDSCGAHKDMDYSTMQKGIAALRPFWPRMALASCAEELRDLGIEAEQAMMAATGGVNTHRGAIFCMGLALNARGDSQRMAALAREICGDNHSAGARSMALGGYKQLFEDWLPYYAAGAGEPGTLLRIMSTLEDTCVMHRVGFERAQQVKREAAEMLRCAQDDKLREMCKQYAAEGISPGGAADMLALTIFIHSIIS